MMNNNTAVGNVNVFLENDEDIVNIVIDLLLTKFIDKEVAALDQQRYNSSSKSKEDNRDDK